ncbi:hypothetical protein CR513_30232, partial [Mucuna pruriens]
MDRIFKDIIGHDLEDYVDDMVAKSTTAKNHCDALQRVFEVLKKHWLKGAIAGGKDHNLITFLIPVGKNHLTDLSQPKEEQKIHMDDKE